MLVKLWVLLLFFCTFVNCDSEGKTFHEINGTVITNQTFTRADGPYLVTSDLVIAENASVTIEAGTEVLLVPSVGIHVHGTLLAKGTNSKRITFQSILCNETNFCNDTKSPEFYIKPGIRLVDGTSYNNGRLELEWNGQWGTICGGRYYYYVWDKKNAEVACRQLGFLGAKRQYFLTATSGPIWMSNVRCNGNEESLFQCGYRGIGNTGCSHWRDVAIECHTLIPYLAERVYWKGIHFLPSNISGKQGNSTLEHVQIINAFEGIRALKKAPNLFNVTVRDGFTGLMTRELEDPLRVVDSKFLNCYYIGVNITSFWGPVVIQNVAVKSTRYGNGLVYKQIADAVDFCSIIPEEASFPLVLNASANALLHNCSKENKARDGSPLLEEWQAKFMEYFSNTRRWMES